MPIRFNLDGSIVIDTVEEAIAFERQRQKPKIKVKIATKANKAPPRSGWDGFCDSLEGHKANVARKVLALIKGRGGHGLSLEDLAIQVPVPKTKIMGSLSRFVKLARRFGLDPQDVVTRDSDGLYRPGHLLATNDPPEP